MKLQQFEKERRPLQSQVKVLEGKAAQLEELHRKRAALLDELSAADSELSYRREEEYAAIAEASHGRLDLTLERGTNHTAYFHALMEFKRGSRLQQRDIQQLVSRVGPRELVDLVLAEDAKGLASRSGFELPAAERLIHALLGVDDLTELLSLQHAVLPEDVPRIRFRKEDGKYHELSSLSVGQKCTALLIIALARGNMPVVIDQPEDALDVPSIYEDVTQQLRVRKDGRQFILTTHNATVAVAGDTDKFHVLKGDAAAGAVLVLLHADHAAYSG